MLALRVGVMLTLPVAQAVAVEEGVWVPLPLAPRAEGLPGMPGVGVAPQVAVALPVAPLPASMVGVTGAVGVPAGAAVGVLRPTDAVAVAVPPPAPSPAPAVAVATGVSVEAPAMSPSAPPPPPPLPLEGEGRAEGEAVAVPVPGTGEAEGEARGALGVGERDGEKGGVPVGDPVGVKVRLPEAEALGQVVPVAVDCAPAAAAASKEGVGRGGEGVELTDPLPPRIVVGEAVGRDVAVPPPAMASGPLGESVGEGLAVAQDVALPPPPAEALRVGDAVGVSVPLGDGEPTPPPHPPPFAVKEGEGDAVEAEEGELDAVGVGVTGAVAVPAPAPEEPLGDPDTVMAAVELGVLPAILPPKPPGVSVEVGVLPPCASPCPPALAVGAELGLRALRPVTEGEEERVVLGVEDRLSMGEREAVVEAVVEREAALCAPPPPDGEGEGERLPPGCVALAPPGAAAPADAVSDSDGDTVVDTDLEAREGEGGGEKDTVPAVGSLGEGVRDSVGVPLIGGVGVGVGLLQAGVPVPGGAEGEVLQEGLCAMLCVAQGEGEEVAVPVALRRAVAEVAPVPPREKEGGWVRVVGGEGVAELLALPPMPPLPLGLAVAVAVAVPHTVWLGVPDAAPEVLSESVAWALLLGEGVGLPDRGAEMLARALDEGEGVRAAVALAWREVRGEALLPSVRDAVTVAQLLAVVLAQALEVGVEVSVAVALGQWEGVAVGRAPLDAVALLLSPPPARLRLPVARGVPVALRLPPAPPPCRLLALTQPLALGECVREREKEGEGDWEGVVDGVRVGRGEREREGEALMLALCAALPLPPPRDTLEEGEALALEVAEGVMEGECELAALREEEGVEVAQACP